MVSDPNKLWEKALTGIETSLSQANFGTWFKNTHIVKIDTGTIYLGVPNTFAKEWLSTKYHKFIIKSLRDLEPEIRSLDYIITKSEPKNGPTITDPPREKTASDQLGLGELYINKEDNLNPKYIFDSFIVGSFNELAHAAAQAVVKKPGSAYNPLFIYGGTGLGKTHLIQAVGNHFKKLGGKKIYYVTSEQFTIDYVNSVQSNRGNFFKEKYRKYDLLIMDDVQFLSGKERTQEELFHLFNTFYENNRQIIFSSDKPPKQIGGLEERLRSRFEGGMIADVSKPDYESRLAILKTKATGNNFFLSDEIIEYLASIIQDNIRELEGALNALICQVEIRKRHLTVNEVKALVKNSIKPKRSISIKDLATIVSDFYNIEERSLYEKTRKKEVVKPRQVIMYLLREDFNTSYPYIGQKLGGRDHTTVIHAYEKIKKEIKNDALLNQEIDQIRALLYRE